MFADVVIHSGGWGLGEILIGAIILIAIVAIFLVYCRAAGVAVPSWFPQIAWICVAAFVAIVAIKFLLSL